MRTRWHGDTIKFGKIQQKLAKVDKNWPKVNQKLAKIVKSWEKLETFGQKLLKVVKSCQRLQKSC